MNRFEWDGEKYRNSEKKADLGNRRRVVKNLARLVKNPFGYLVWKVPFIRKGISVVWILGAAALGVTLSEAGQTATSAQYL